MVSNIFGNIFNTLTPLFWDGHGISSNDTLFSENTYMSSKLKCFYGQENNAKSHTSYGYKHIFLIMQEDIEKQINR